jgi:hypothetical protein
MIFGCDKAALVSWGNAHKLACGIQENKQQ